MFCTVIAVRDIRSKVVQPEFVLVHPFDFRKGAKLPGYTRKQVQRWLDKNRSKRFKVLAVRAFGEGQFSRLDSAILKMSLCRDLEHEKIIVRLISVVALQLWEAGRDHATREFIDDF
ncbi:hypothetical protein KJ785_02360 [Patescibacteria group bacterium]|nr:hypothetical protein [Patescibacteria group bacterium]